MGVVSFILRWKYRRSEKLVDLTKLIETKPAVKPELFRVTTHALFSITQLPLDGRAVRESNWKTKFISEGETQMSPQEKGKWKTYWKKRFQMLVLKKIN